MKTYWIILAALLCGCSTRASLFPVDGPLARMSPPPILEATVDGIMGNTGNIFLGMPDGETCKGRWSSLAPVHVKQPAASASGGMAALWASVYGSSYSVENVPGVNKGEAMLVCDKGTVMQVEFLTGSGTANGTGIAKDNRGNIFKVLF